MLHGGKRTSIRRHRPRGELELPHLLAGCLLIWTATNGDTKWVLTTWCKLNYRKKACTVWHCLCSCAAATACTGIRVIDLFSLFFVSLWWLSFGYVKPERCDCKKMQATPKLILKILWLVCLGCHVYFYNRNSTYSLATLQQDCWCNIHIFKLLSVLNLFWSLFLSEWSSKTGQHRIPEASDNWKGTGVFKHVQDLGGQICKKTITRKRRLWISGGRRRCRLHQIAGDGAESRNPQIRGPRTPRRHRRGGCLLRVRHRGQVRRLQGRCCKFPLRFSSPPLILGAILLLSVTETILHQRGEETGFDLFSWSYSAG